MLRAVPLIAAEDTRLTRRLLDRHGIDVRLTSYHAKSGPRAHGLPAPAPARWGDLALVSDAGTPVVSDPGGELVTAWAGEGGTVVALPGPSAVVTAVAVSGVAGPHWTFEGFLPRSGRERRERLARIAADERGAIIFEAPNRVAGTLRDLATVCGPERPAAVCRELTKLHETVSRGALGELAEAAGSGAIPARGEFVLVVGAWTGAGAQAGEGDSAAAMDAARAEVERLVADGLARSDAARRVAAATGLPRRALYGASPD